jgi:DNA polymerase III delta subunit
VPSVTDGTLFLVAGPGDAGPGDRDEMLRRGYSALEEAGVDGVDRLDVPSKGTAGEETDGGFRADVAGMVPALQSGSLFGGRRGLLVMDAQNLLKAEAEAAADLIAGLEGGGTVVCFVSAGPLPAPLSKVVERLGEKLSVKKLRERDALEWLVGAARARKVSLGAEAAAALVQRFGSDIASLGQALDQLSVVEGPVTAAEVAARFRNRPDEPMWHYADALGEGDTATALRRLADFLTHGHPLQLLSFLESDLRRRALALAAPDIGTFAEWIGSSATQFPVQKAWKARGRTTPELLHRALGALARADLQLKSMPEAIHRLTLERLTVALCMWYGGRKPRRG